MEILIGYTGFVGSNICSRHNFGGLYNSKNIADAYGTNPELCVYAGVRAEKFAADNFPGRDLWHIEDALENIRRIAPGKLALISTIDVIPPQTGDVYEDTPYKTDTLTPYGQNRLLLEHEARKLCPNTLVVRLPGLFGGGLKKNFIFDMINFIPAMLKKAKFEELRGVAPELGDFYKEDENGFFRLVPDITHEDREILKSLFVKLGFSALNFTDSRSKYAFYDLKYLYKHIKILLDNDIPLAHIATGPVSASELHDAVYGRGFVNEITERPFDYSFFKTRYAALLEESAAGGYIFGGARVTAEAAEFIKTSQKAF